MSVLLGSNDNSSVPDITESLLSAASEARRRWSALVDARTAGSPIVSWLHPQSVTLRAYVQLLVDRLRAKSCGPCVRSEKRKRKCRQPRCIRYKCVWTLISSEKGCRFNADGDTISPFTEARADTTRQCQQKCENDNECMAMDFNPYIKNKKHACLLFRRPCSKPMRFPRVSYRLELQKNDGRAFVTKT